MGETWITGRGRRRDQLFLEEQKSFHKRGTTWDKSWRMTEDLQGRQGGVGENSLEGEKARIKSWNPSKYMAYLGYIKYFKVAGELNIWGKVAGNKSNSFPVEDFFSPWKLFHVFTMLLNLLGFHPTIHWSFSWQLCFTLWWQEVIKWALHLSITNSANIPQPISMGSFYDSDSADKMWEASFFPCVLDSIPFSLLMKFCLLRLSFSSDSTSLFLSFPDYSHKVTNGF